MARLRSALVVLQAALAVILLARHGPHGPLLWINCKRVDLGFRSQRIVRVFIAFPKGYDLKPEARLQLFERIAATARQPSRGAGRSPLARIRC